MKLIEMKEGTKCILKNAGGREHFADRAISMGLAVGTKIEVVRNQKKMPLLIYARES